MHTIPILGSRYKAIDTIRDLCTSMLEEETLFFGFFVFFLRSLFAGMPLSVLKNCMEVGLVHKKAS